MHGVKVGYWDVNGAICGGGGGGDERASEPASQPARERRTRYQSPALKAASKRVLSAYTPWRMRREGRANAPRYQCPWTQFTSIFESYHIHPCCIEARAFPLFLSFFLFNVHWDCQFGNLSRKHKHGSRASSREIGDRCSEGIDIASQNR